MLTSKQRSRLRAYANKTETIMQIGKDGISEKLVKQVDDALTARELIKLRVLESSPLTAAEAAEKLACDTNSESVMIIGSRFVLYRRNPRKGLLDDYLM